MAYGQNLQTPNFANATGQSPSERWRFSTLSDMMLSIGLAGIDYNDSIMDTMEGQQALRILTDVIYEVQSEGWEFNTITGEDFVLGTEGKLQFLPISDFNGLDNTAAIPLHGSYIFSLVGQSDNLFIDQNGNLHNHSNVGASLLKNSIVVGKPGQSITINKMIIERWQQMHFSLSMYVAALAVNRYQGLMVGDGDKIRFGQNEIQVMYAKARRDEVRSGKYNILTSTFGVGVNRG